MESNAVDPLGGNFSQSERRALSDAERTLLEWLLANGAPDARQFESQIAQVRVVGRCTCGCPTIDLAIGDRERRTIGASHILAEAEGITPEGIEVGVILHAREGQLSELEVYPIPEVDAPFSLPSIASLKKA
jgi:hypothetical protein